MLREFFRRRQAPADPIESAFGILEREVMTVLWAEGDLAVREVQARLPRRVAYTTVMTTLDRLFKKGVLSRRAIGRAFSYSPSLTRSELQASIASQVLTGLLASRQEAAVPVLSNLVESVADGEDGEALLQQLEALIRDKRKELTRARPR